MCSCVCVCVSSRAQAWPQGAQVRRVLAAARRHEMHEAITRRGPHYARPSQIITCLISGHYTQRSRWPPLSITRHRFRSAWPLSGIPICIYLHNLSRKGAQQLSSLASMSPLSVNFAACRSSIPRITKSSGTGFLSTPYFKNGVISPSITPLGKPRNHSQDPSLAHRSPINQLHPSTVPRPAYCSP